MARIAPFRGLFYNEKKIRDLAKVVAPPYDVVSPDEQERLYKKSPYNFIRLDLNQEPDSYQSVAQMLTEWQAQGILVRDDVPAIYYLTHRFRLKNGEEKTRQGFFALTELQDFSTGKIRPHEKTHPTPKQDRLKLMLASNAQLSPIFMLYSEPKQMVNRILAMAVEGMPAFMEVDQDNGDRCRLWRITDAAVINKLEQQLKDDWLLIADGHHRYEATLAYRDHMRSAEPWNGREAFTYIMAYFANIDDPNLVILPTHRLVRGFAPKPFMELEAALEKHFHVEQYPKTADGRSSFVKALTSAAKKYRVIGASFKRDPRYLILRLKNKRMLQSLAKDLSGPLRDLDVSTLHLLILGQILGLSAEQQASGENIRYTQDEESALQALEKEDYQAVFILTPPKVEEILAIVSSGEKMPQKSTYFYPKLLSGMIINKIDPEEQIEVPGGLSTDVDLLSKP
jgi:uncharacterized protein (DUF1015 family)